MNISELKAGNKGLTLRGKIAKLPPARQVMTRFGSTTTVTNATMEDDSGSIKLVLWGDQVKGLKEGDEIELTDGYVKEWRGERQLGVSRSGTIKAVKKEKEKKETAKAKPKAKAAKK